MSRRRTSWSSFLFFRSSFALEMYPSSVRVVTHADDVQCGMFLSENSRMGRLVDDLNNCSGIIFT
jgi:hypothetical protein